MKKRDAAPPPPPDRLVAYLPPQASDFDLIVRGRRAPRLSRLVGLVLAPIFRWRMERRLGVRRGRR